MGRRDARAARVLARLQQDERLQQTMDAYVATLDADAVAAMSPVDVMLNCMRVAVCAGDFVQAASFARSVVSFVQAKPKPVITRVEVDLRTEDDLHDEIREIQLRAELLKRSRKAHDC
jgi:hypothetical protein